MTRTTHGLNSLLLKTPGLSVLKISSHLNYNRDISTTAKKSTSLHIDVEVSNPQRKVLQVTHSSTLTKQKITEYVSGKGASMRLTDRKIDSLVSIKPYSRLVNDKEKLTKWRNQVFLAKTIADIQSHNKAATLKKKASDAGALVLLAADDR